MKGGYLFLWILVGAAYGLVLRGAFGSLSLANSGVFSSAFLLGTPTAVGAIVIYGLRKDKPSIGAMIFLPWIAVILALLGSGLLLLEGSVCIVLASPLFLLMSSIGGLVMGLTLRWTSKGKTTINSMIALPLVLAVIEPVLPHPAQVLEERVAVEITATPHRIWEEILNARDIRKEELPPSFTHLIGVPRPLEGVNVMTPEGEIRNSTWERGVHFTAHVTSRDEDRSITWRYEFTPGSFPPGSLDDHVKIGGDYFDLIDTTFNLTPLSDGKTRLEIISHYKVTTDINFYGVPVARLIAHDFMSTILGLYKGRSERPEG